MLRRHAAACQPPPVLAQSRVHLATTGTGV